MKFSNKVFSFLIFFLCWQIISMLVNKAFLPSPLETLDGLIDIVSDGSILIHTCISFIRIIISLAISLLIAVPLGIFIGYKDEVYDLLYPLVSTLYPIPKVVFLPVLVLFFGLGNISKIVLISSIISFQLLLVVIDSVRNLPSDLFISIYSLSQSFKDILLNLILPYILPDLLTAMRICVGTAISVLFFSETFASFDGLGYFILDTMAKREYKQMYAGIIVMSLLGLLLYKFLYLIEKHTCHWKNHK